MPLLLFASAVVLLGLLLVVYIRFVEPNWLLVRRVRIDTKRCPNNGEPLRIALLSDFHYPRHADLRLVRRAIEKSNQFDPDLVFLLGDFFDKNRGDAAIVPNNVREVFGGIHNRLGVFGVLGNHDHWFDAQAIRDALKTQTDIQLVDNASVPIESSIGTLYIAGVGDLWSHDSDYAQATREIPPDSPILLLSHNPDVVEEISDPRILIQFSGHTHGGQIRLPFVGAIRVPSKFGDKYSQGMSNAGNHLLYVTRGVCSMKRIRFLCPPEVTWVEIF